MKIETKKLSTLIAIMESLSKGTDPTSGVDFSHETILNSPLLNSAFADVAEILRALEEQDGVIHKGRARRKLEFYMTSQEYEAITLSDDAITISKFVHQINEKIHRDTMKKLRATQITEWLVENEYLTEVQLTGEAYSKQATAKGIEAGITSVKKVNSIGVEYITNFYDKSAQAFILHHVLFTFNV